MSGPLRVSERSLSNASLDFTPDLPRYNENEVSVDSIEINFSETSFFKKKLGTVLEKIRAFFYWIFPCFVPKKEKVEQDPHVILEDMEGSVAYFYPNTSNVCFPEGEGEPLQGSEEAFHRCLQMILTFRGRAFPLTQLLLEFGRRSTLLLFLPKLQKLGVDPSMENRGWEGIEPLFAAFVLQRYGFETKVYKVNGNASPHCPKKVFHRKKSLSFEKFKEKLRQHFQDLGAYPVFIFNKNEALNILSFTEEGMEIANPQKGGLGITHIQFDDKGAPLKGQGEDSAAIDSADLPSFESENFWTAIFPS